jgi:hypothetical protein
MDDLVERGEELARRQRDFANRLRRNFGSRAGDQDGQPQAGEGQPQAGAAADARAMSAEKERMIEDLKKLESDIQGAARAMAGGQRKASAKLRDALGNLQQEELQHRMKWSAEYLRRGLGQFVVMREAVTTQALDTLAEQLKDAQKAIGPGDARPGDQKGLEEALAQTERLRRQMASLNPGRRNQQGGQRGQEGARGQQSGGQSGGAQRGQEGARGQSGGGQPGGEGREESASRFGGGGWNGGGWQAINRGERLPGPPAGEAPRTSPEDLERAYREGARDLGRLRQALEGSPELTRDVQNLVREMQQLDPSRFGGNPELLEQLHARVLAEIEQVELELRRMVDDKEGGRVRSGTGDPPPPGYADAVAEYFRRLSGK